MLYHFRTSLAYRYLEFKTRGLDATPQLASAPHAQCEAHTMLGARDVTMYVLAIKSLLSYVSDLAVVVHSDGTLSEHDRRRVGRHIAGVRFVLPEQADAHAATSLRESPFLLEWRGNDAAYRRLVDVELWRGAAKVIVLDSDVLTNRSPDEVAGWVRSGNKPFLLGQPSGQPLVSPPDRSEHVQAQFLRKVPEISARLQKPSSFLQGATAGFCGYFNEISLTSIERGLQTALDLGLPMHQWGGDQCLVIYLLSIGGAERLPVDRYINFEPSIRASAEQAAMIHFYGTHRFHGLVYPRLAAACVRRLRSL
jgi:hypothetical protein